MSNHPEIDVQHQTAFDENGELEVTETSVETSLEDFGATVDHRERDSRRDRPAASEFGIDDRPEVQSSSETDSNQTQLFADIAEDQRTLTGEADAERSLYGESTIHD